MRFDSCFTKVNRRRYPSGTVNNSTASILYVRSFHVYNNVQSDLIKSVDLRSLFGNTSDSWSSP